MRYFGRLAKRIGVTVVVALCIGTGLLLTIGVGRATAAGGSIAGHVTAAAGGANLQGICVGAFTHGTNSFASNAATASDGTYTIAGLAAGSYDVRFDSSGFCPGGTTTSYVTQWWDNHASQSAADAVSVTDGGTHSGIDALMVAGGSIAGHVTAASGGTNLAGICVFASSGDAFSPPTGIAATASDGTYTIVGLAEGSYVVRFDSDGFCGSGGTPSNYVTQWFDNRSTPNVATPVAVDAGSTTSNINAAMVAGATIAGHVTAASGGTNLAGICVTASPGDAFAQPAGSAATASDGTYAITRLGQGSYVVRFDSQGFCQNGIGGNYVTQWWENRSDPNVATPVAVGAGSTTSNINAAMVAGGSISGHVTDDAVSPANLGGICVRAVTHGVFGPPNGQATTAIDGTYTMAGVAAGDYDVSFDSSGFCPNGTASNYVTQWWDDKPDQSAADSVTVTAGATTTGIDAALAAGGSIAGTVTKATDASSLEGICASAYTGDASGPPAGNSATASDGTYTITGLAPGSYLVSFDSEGFCPNGAPSDYVTQWWNDKPDPSSADAVSVSAGATTTGIDAAMVVTPSGNPGGGGGGGGGGSTVSSDPHGTKPTSDNPEIVTVSDPSAGGITITKKSGGTTTAGYSALGFGANITAPNATPGNPITIVFQIADSALPPGTDPLSVGVFRDGVLIAHCPGATTANPDPCISDQTDTSGVLTITVRTSHASAWSFGALRVTTRIAGDDRILTAIAVSGSSFSTSGSAAAVVLARSDDFADALAGTPLAVKKNGPLLLTAPSSLDGRVNAEIQRVLPAGATVYLLGGPAALDPSIATGLTNLGYTVMRYQGVDRYGTAVAIADQGLGNPSTVLEATGLNFPDALAAGAAASEAGGAVLLTANNVMPATTQTYLAAHPGDRRFALGGPAAAADPTAAPIVGADRFETATKVAEAFFNGPTVVGVADAFNFPDALAGGPHTGANRGPIVLVPTTGDLPTAVMSYLTANAGSVVHAYVYGGTTAVSDDVLAKVSAALGTA